MFKRFFKAYGRKVCCVLKRYKGTGVDAEVLQKLDKGYKKLIKSNSRSLLKRHLTPELFEIIKTKRTKSSTLLDCIQSGLIYHDSVCGIYAACPQSYTVFAELFDPIIKESHYGYRSTFKQPSVDFGHPSTFENIDPYNNYIASTRIRCARSIKGFPFNPCMTRKHYDEIEDIVKSALLTLGGECKGTYHHLLGMSKAAQTELVNDHFLFNPGDRFLRAANACRYWPFGRGFYSNVDKSFLAWCNGEDHLRLISMQRGGNFGEVYARLLKGLSSIESKIPFVRDNKLGFLTFCPTNLGTSLRASVHIKIPKLAANKELLEKVARQHKLQIQSIHGERTKAEDCLYEISNKRQLGLTEYDAVNEVYTGIREIIELEKQGRTVVVVEKKPQPPPAHIDIEKAIKSGFIDERKKKRRPVKATIKTRHRQVLPKRKQKKYA